MHSLASQVFPFSLMLFSSSSSCAASLSISLSLSLSLSPFSCLGLPALLRCSLVAYDSLCLSFTPFASISICSSSMFIIMTCTCRLSHAHPSALTFLSVSYAYLVIRVHVQSILHSAMLFPFIVLHPSTTSSALLAPAFSSLTLYTHT